MPKQKCKKKSSNPIIKIYNTGANWCKTKKKEIFNNPENTHLLKRNDSTRGSSKKARTSRKADNTVNKHDAGTALPTMQQNPTPDIAALLIFNSEYQTDEFGARDLEGVREDEPRMKGMLGDGYHVEVAHNVEDIESVVKEFSKRHANAKEKHVHYSGHGVHNATLKIGQDEVEKWKKTKILTSKNPSGDCLVGVTGELFTVHDLKHTVLETAGLVTVTLDMCRNRNDKRGKSNYCVSLRYEEEISHDDLERIAILYGTSDLHFAGDYNSFTKELHKVIEANGGQLPILSITGKVNKSWKDRGVKQYSKDDIIKVEGGIWTNRNWPSINVVTGNLVDVSQETVADKSDGQIPPSQDQIWKELKKLQEGHMQLSTDNQELRGENKVLKSMVGSMKTEITDLKSNQSIRRKRKISPNDGDMPATKVPNSRTSGTFV